METLFQKQIECVEFLGRKVDMHSYHIEACELPSSVIMLIHQLILGLREKPVTGTRPIAYHQCRIMRVVSRKVTYKIISRSSNPLDSWTKLSMQFLESTLEHWRWQAAFTDPIELVLEPAKKASGKWKFQNWPDIDNSQDTKCAEIKSYDYLL